MYILNVSSSSYTKHLILFSLRNSINYCIVCTSKLDSEKNTYEVLEASILAISSVFYVSSKALAYFFGILVNIYHSAFSHLLDFNKYTKLF